MIARSPCLTPTTLRELNRSANTHSKAITLMASTLGVTQEYGLWGSAASTGPARKGLQQHRLQDIFTWLLITGNSSVPGDLHDVHLRRCVCGMSSSVMSL